MRLVFPMTAVVKRELLVNMRKKAPFFCLVLLVVIVMFIVIGWWPTDRMSQYYISNMAFMSSQLLGVLAISLLCSAGIFIPSMSAGAFVSEKTRDTYDLLKLTLVSPSGMIIAKLCNTVGMLFLIVVGTFPIFGTIFFLIGLDVSQVVQAFCVILASSISVSMIGIFCSSFFKRTIPATISSYLLGAFLMGAWMLIPTIVVFILSEIIFQNYFWVGDLIRSFQQIAMYTFFSTFPGATLAGIVMGGIPRISMTMVFYYALLFHGLISLVMFWLTLRVLRRPEKPIKVSRKKLIDDPERLMDRRKGFPYYLIDPLRRRKPINEKRNPMLIKELRYGIGHKLVVMFRTFYIGLLLTCLIMSIFFVFGGINRGKLIYFDDEIIILFTTHAALIVLVAPMFLSNAFTKEYEQGNIDMLKMTLLSPCDIIIGKIVAGFVSLMPLILIAVISSLFLLIYKMNLWSLLSVLVGFVGLLESVFVAMSLSLYISSVVKRTGTALISVYLMEIIIFIGLSIGMIFWADMTDIYPRIEGDMLSAMFSPILSFYGFAEYHSRFDYILKWLISFICYNSLAVAGIIGSMQRFKLRRLESGS